MSPRAKKQVSEAVARPARGVIQATPAYIITSFIDSTVWDMDDQTFGLVVVGLTAVFSFIQNKLENKKGKAWWLRSVPPESVPAGGQ